MTSSDVQMEDASMRTVNVMALVTAQTIQMNTVDVVCRCSIYVITNTNSIQILASTCLRKVVDKIANE